MNALKMYKRKCGHTAADLLCCPMCYKCVDCCECTDGDKELFKGLALNKFTRVETEKANEWWANAKREGVGEKTEVTTCEQGRSGFTIRTSNGQDTPD